MEELNKKIEDIKLKKPKCNIILETTVPTGLEIAAVNEIVQKGICKADDIHFVPGRVYFHLPIELFEKVKTLHSIDNIHLVVELIRNINFIGEKQADLKEIISLLDVIDIKTSVKLWKTLTNYERIIEPTKKQHDEARVKQDEFKSDIKRQKIEKENDDEKYKHDVLKYRVTCDRIGDNHSFTSNEAAYKFGGEINDRYFWLVDLMFYDLNIYLRINKTDAMVLLKVTVQSLHRRNKVAGPMSLRPTISYGMLSLAQLKPGDHLVDPMCGWASIGVECMYAFPEVIISCGEINENTVERARKNILDENITSSNDLQLFRWDACFLPFANHSIDAIVSNLPFGRRCGSRTFNRDLYRKAFTEFARVLKINTGRVVLLSRDITNLFKALDYKQPETCWDITQILKVNVGNLKCNLVVAIRKET